jgi:hypothetical protein
MALLAGIAYLSLSSLYLVMTDAWVEHRLTAIQADSTAVQELRKDVRFMQSEINEVAGVFSEVAPLWVTWDVVTDLLKKGVAVSRINSIDGSVTITCDGSQSLRNFELPEQRFESFRGQIRPADSASWATTVLCCRCAV